MAASGSLKLSLSAPFNVQDFALSPDGRWVVYTDDALTLSGPALYSVALDGSSFARISPEGEPGAEIERFAISTDSSRVVFVGADRHLYSVPVAGPATAAVALTAEPLSPLVSDFTISPDSSRVLFRAGHGGSADLFSTPIDGSAAAVPLHDATPLGYAAGNVYRIAPDSSRVVYDSITVFDPPSFAFTPYSVPIDRSSPPVVLHETIATDLPMLELTPDGTRVIFRVGEGTELRSVPIDDPASPSSILLPADTSRARDVAISPDSRWVAFLAADDLSPRVDLYLARTDRSGTAARAFPSVLGAPVVHDFEIAPSSQRVVFTVEKSSTAPIELFSAPMDPRGGAVQLNDPIEPPEGDVLDFQISPDGQWVVYRADQLFEDWPMGFRVPIDGPAGSAEPIWALAPLEARDWRIHPNGRSVVVASVQPFADQIYRPWSVRLVGTPQPARELVEAADFQPDGDLAEMRVGAGGRIVYLADQDEDQVLELYLVTLLFADGFESGDTAAWQ
jgi:Tol biopolymer transport system component